MNNFYRTLGVASDASVGEIKHAYRRLARELHPDVNHTGASTEQYFAVQEAYNVLSDAQKRADYDAILRMAVFADVTVVEHNGGGVTTVSRVETVEDESSYTRISAWVWGLALIVGGVVADHSGVSYGTDNAARAVVVLGLITLITAIASKLRL